MNTPQSRLFEQSIVYEVKHLQNLSMQIIARKSAYKPHEQKFAESVLKLCEDFFHEKDGK